MVYSYCELNIITKEILMEKAAITFFTTCLIVFLYVFCIWTPVNLIDKAKCLELGYSETNTTITLTSYCVKVDGDKGSVVMELTE